MKILILANNDIGLYQFRRELIEELLKKNEVTISLPYGELIEPLKKMGCYFIDTPVDRRGINPFKDLKLMLKYMALLKAEAPELVVTYTIKPNIYGGMMCRIRKIPYAVNITGLGTAFQKKGFLRKLVVTLYKQGLKKANLIFFENIENRQIFVEQGIVEEKDTCVLNGAGVNLKHYQVAEYPTEEGGIRSLFIGRVMKEKGIDELFSVMQMLQKDEIDCTLDVLGEYEEDYKDKMEQYSSEGWLRYHGYQKDVRPYIASAHCFVLPSWHEGMANTNLECAAMGRPVITSNIHGCLEAVEDGTTGFLCERKNVDDLHRVMKIFSELPYEEKKQMGLSGRRRMETLFNKRMIVQKTVAELYNHRRN